jgi:putative hydroxymethylpyrimidine transport system substrate-binding protein
MGPSPTGRTGSLTRRLVPVVLLVAALVLAACGERKEPTAAAPGQKRVTLLLDWLPNADHAPIYAAQATGAFRKAGLDVRIETPSDATTPLKLLAARRVDLAITYEPELLLARDKGQGLVGVGALVQRPLSSLISLKGKVKAPKDLAGKRVGVTGLPSDEAALRAILAKAGVDRNRVKTVDVGFNLVPSLLGKKVDAILGAYWNVEAVQLARQHKNPSVIPIDQAGVPTYDELVICASEKTVRDHPGRIRRFLAGLADGARRLAAAPARETTAGLLRMNRSLDPRLQQASVAITVPYMLSPRGRRYGWLDPGEWTAFTSFMHRNGLLRLTTPRGAFTNALLPATGG